MDLQTAATTLANTPAADSPGDPRPRWANWRDEVFSTGTDPIVMATRAQAGRGARAAHPPRAAVAAGARPGRPAPCVDYDAGAIGYLAATQDTPWQHGAGAGGAGPERRAGCLVGRRWTCAATPRWPTTCWSPYPPPHRTRRRWARHLPARLHADAVACCADPAPGAAPDLGAMFLDSLPRGQHMIAQAFMRPVGDGWAAGGPAGPAWAAVRRDALKKRHFRTCGGRRSAADAGGKPSVLSSETPAPNGTPGRPPPSAQAASSSNCTCPCITSGCRPCPGRQDAAQWIAVHHQHRRRRPAR